MKATGRVYVRSADGAHEAWLGRGDTVPDWAEVTNPAAVEDDAEVEEAAEAPKPARRRTSTK